MPNRPSIDRDLGTVSCSLRGDVVAGSYQTCVLTYKAGQAGIDDTGSLKVVMRYATDCGVPQFSAPVEPNYVTARASNGAQLALRYDVKDNTRPWGKTLLIKVLQGYLRRGDTITLTLGDTAEGSPGWRMQTFLERTFELRVLVDRYATYVYEPLSRQPTFRIVAGRPVRLVAVAPSAARLGQRLLVRSRREDAWGNPVGKPRREWFAGTDEPGCRRLQVEDPETGLTAETNPIVIDDQAPPGGGRFWADVHGQSEETIGTNSIDDYFRFARDWAFLDVCGHQGNDFQITDEFWNKIQETTARLNRPSKFVTFPGWEWSGNTGLGGDRNVFFREEGGPIRRSSRALVGPEEARDPCSTTVEDLFRNLRPLGERVMLVPHVGGRFADLERHDESLEPVVEVHSAWGTFEWMLDDAFQRGYRIGIVANSDGHKGRPGASWPGASTFGSYGGLTCVLADRLDRDAIWSAYRARRVYATTGSRIWLDVQTSSGESMGAVRTVRADDLPALRLRVRGTASLERVELRCGMRVLKTWRPYTAAETGPRLLVLWEGAEVRGRGRQVVWDGGLTIRENSIRSLTPINFHNPELPLEQLDRRRVQWRSLTTGGASGLILELARPDRGVLEVQTKPKRFRLSLERLPLRGKRYACGGLGKQITVTPLPSAGDRRDLDLEANLRWIDLRENDNPLYFVVYQEDGHRAWSSPVYYVREQTE